MVDWKEQYLSFMSKEAIRYVQYSIRYRYMFKKIYNFNFFISWIRIQKEKQKLCEVFCETSYSVHHRRLCEVPMQYRYIFCIINYIC